MLNQGSARQAQLKQRHWSAAKTASARTRNTHDPSAHHKPFTTPNAAPRPTLSSITAPSTTGSTQVQSPPTRTTRAVVRGPRLHGASHDAIVSSSGESPKASPPTATVSNKISESKQVFPRKAKRSRHDDCEIIAWKQLSYTSGQPWTFEIGRDGKTNNKILTQ